jgi:hypothetical protein
MYILAEGSVMNKGKPSGKYAENKSRPGRKGDYKRGAWPEELRHQHISGADDADVAPGEGSGRNRKAGSPI